MCFLPKRASIIKKATSQSNNKHQISIYLESEDVENVKAIAIAQDLSLSSVIVNLMQEGLKNEQYQTIIQAYQQFKNKVS